MYIVCSASTISVNTRRWPNVALRRATIKSTLVRRLVFAGMDQYSSILMYNLVYGDKHQIIT